MLNEALLFTDYSSTYLQGDESYFLTIPSTSTRRFFNTSLFQTSSTNGFRVLFQELYLSGYDNIVQIGTGLDPSNTQSVVTTISGYRNYADDVYVETNEMWFTVIGGQTFSRLRMDVEIIAIDLSSEYDCSRMFRIRGYNNFSCFVCTYICFKK